MPAQRFQWPILVPAVMPKYNVLVSAAASCGPTTLVPDGGSQLHCLRIVDLGCGQELRTCPAKIWELTVCSPALMNESCTGSADPRVAASTQRGHGVSCRDSIHSVG